jgi:hypothetical protein
MTEATENRTSNWAEDTNSRITKAMLAAIAAGKDQETAEMTAAIAAVSGAVLPLEAVTAYQTAASRLDRGRPRGIGGPDVLPVRTDGDDWTWCRVDTRGTGNGGRWVATRPLSERARALRDALMASLARLMPGFNVAFLATCSLFWEGPTLEWMGTLSPEMATWLGNQPSVESRRQAEALERKGFTLPKTSIPRTSAAIAMAAEAARRAK